MKVQKKANLRNGFEFDKNYNLYISMIKQDATLNLDEKGTTASVVTEYGGGMLLGDFEPEYKKSKTRGVDV